jgi:hypothetical protein
MIRCVGRAAADGADPSVAVEYAEAEPVAVDSTVATFIGASSAAIIGAAGLRSVVCAPTARLSRPPASGCRTRPCRFSR